MHPNATFRVHPLAKTDYEPKIGGPGHVNTADTKVEKLRVAVCVPLCSRMLGVYLERSFQPDSEAQ